MERSFVLYLPDHKGNTHKVKPEDLKFISASEDKEGTTTIVMEFPSNPLKKEVKLFWDCRENDPVLLPPIDPSDFEMLSRCREAYNETKTLLGEEDKGHLIEMCQTLINKDGAQGAWPNFKFEEKVDPQFIETFKKAFRYMEFISMEHMAKEGDNKC